MATEKNETELYFEWWLEELKSVGLVISYEREPKTFVIHDAVPIFYDQVSKTKSFVKSFELFPTLVYTPDYVVVFNKKLVNKMIGEVDRIGKTLVKNGFDEMGSIYQNTIFYTSELDSNKCLTVWFDVKAPSAAAQVSARVNAASRDFRFTSRMMYERYGIIVNKVVPVGMKTSLFGKTFLPKRYKFTNKSGGIRKLKDYENGFKTLKAYLESRNINL